MAAIAHISNPRARKPLADRLWEKVDIRGPGECWPWLGRAVTSFGYGRMTNGRGVNLKAHRAAWMVTHGGIPPGENVLHSCDNPPCCNPAHLFLGSKKDNTQDMLAKGRGRSPPIHRGENHPRATIPDCEIPIIRSSKEPAQALAKKYGVSDKTIYRIRQRRTRI